MDLTFAPHLCNPVHKESIELPPQIQILNKSIVRLGT
jgi:hypothetical protein